MYVDVDVDEKLDSRGLVRIISGIIDDEIRVLS